PVSRPLMPGIGKLPAATVRRAPAALSRSEAAAWGPVLRAKARDKNTRPRTELRSARETERPLTLRFPPRHNGRARSALWREKSAKSRTRAGRAHIRTPVPRDL